jgi:type I restriction enzyme S subunit
MKRTSLGEIVTLNPTMPRALRSSAPTVFVPFLPMAAVSEDGFARFGERRNLGSVLTGFTYFERGDVLLAKITPCFENGKAAYLGDLPDNFGFGSTEFHVLRPGPEIDAGYLFHAVWNPTFRGSARGHMTGTAGQKRLPADYLRRHRIVLPTLDEQRRITRILDKAVALRRRHQLASRSAADLHASLANRFVL